MTSLSNTHQKSAKPIGRNLMWMVKGQLSCPIVLPDRFREKLGGRWRKSDGGGDGGRGLLTCKRTKAPLVATVPHLVVRIEQRWKVFFQEFVSHTEGKVPGVCPTALYSFVTFVV